MSSYLFTLSAGSNIADTSNLQALRDRFQTLDVNADGVLSKTEIINALVQHGIDQDYASTLTGNIFESCGARSHGAQGEALTYSDFLKEYIRLTRFKALELIQSRFIQIDLNGDGLLSHDEIFHALKQQIGIEATKAHVDSTFQEMDIDKDGMISLKDLWDWYRLKTGEIVAAQNNTSTSSSSSSIASTSS